MNYKNKSIWSEEINETFNKLDCDIETDVLIIGGGITGVSTLYHLKDSNLKVTLVEKNIIGSGITSKTTGKITYNQDIYSKIKNSLGINKAKTYLDSQIYAMNLVKDIINKENIDCNLDKVNSYIFSDNKQKLNKDKNLLKQLNIDIKESNILPNGIKTNSYYVSDTYQFHPIKYINGLVNKCNKENISIYENTKIVYIDKKNDYYICKTDNNTIKCKYVVLALHYPYFLIPFFTPFKTIIEKSYIGVYEVNDYFKFNAINDTKPTISMRYLIDNKVNYEFFLTNAHLSNFKYNEKDNFNIFLKDNLKYLWSNMDILTNDSIPFIGSISCDNTLLLGTGYNTWGMTNGSLAGKIISDIILNKDNKYIDLFNPKRGINIGSILSFPIIIGSNIYSFIANKINKNKSFYSNNVKFEKRNGKNVAIYIDENKKEHIVYNLCPHLKCSLIFNPIELTWDCPCHGSKFDIDGNSLEGPSNYDIKYKD
ncbi:MAG: FAD-dependent oxidoreductase [Bacilli bacterium]|nr:FAD-dependent oxidoreductase [Bacilli bacterium]